MTQNNDRRREHRRLRGLLKSGAYDFHPYPAGYIVSFSGRFRPWEYRLRIEHGWLNVGATVMALPERPATRTAVLECVAAINADLRLVKFTKIAETIWAELQYRREHVTAELLWNLLDLLHGACEDHYPLLYDTASHSSSVMPCEPAASTNQRPTASERAEADDEELARIFERAASDRERLNELDLAFKRPSLNAGQE